jgi:hypothetical protein
MWPTWLSFDDDFQQLSCGGQWLFRLFWTHPDLNSGGYITLAPQAWSTCASDLTVDIVQGQIDELMVMERGGRSWVSVDDRTQELFVRPFIRLDAMKKPHIYVSAMRAVQACRSPMLQQDGWAEINDIHPPLLKRNPKTDPEVYDKLEQQRDAAYDELASVMEGRSERFSNRLRTVREPPSGDGDEPGSGDGQPTVTYNGTEPEPVRASGMSRPPDKRYGECGHCLRGLLRPERAAGICVDCEADLVNGKTPGLTW